MPFREENVIEADTSALGPATGGLRAMGGSPTTHVGKVASVNRLGDLERAIMDVLWGTPQSLTVREVSAQLTERDLAHTTVMTVLDRLAKKGFARRERDGRARRSHPPPPPLAPPPGEGGGAPRGKEVFPPPGGGRGAPGPPAPPRPGKRT